MTIAGLYWAMSHATGQGEDVIAKLRADSGTDRGHGWVPRVFVNIDPIVVLFIAWLVVISASSCWPYSFSSR